MAAPASSRPSPDPRVQALRQHAKTMQLLGVDFLPVRPGEHVQAARTEIEETPQMPAPIAPPPVAAAPRRSAATAPVHVVEPKVSVTQPNHVPAVPRSSPTFAGDALRTERQALLDKLLAKYEADAPHKHFVTDHHSIVFGDGDPAARLMFVGEAPGAEEDKVGRPFVGRAGQLLDKMIVAMGLAREQVYIANVLKTRPPNNATPTPEEAALCAPYLYEQIAIVQPEAIVTLGLPATRLLLNSMDAMGRLRGTWATYKPPVSLQEKSLIKGVTHREVAVMPTYHPAFLLRAYTRENRQKVWSDLQHVVTKLGLKAPTSQSEPA